MVFRGAAWATAGILALSAAVIAAAPATAMQAKTSASAATGHGWQFSFQLPADAGETDRVLAIAATDADHAWAVGGKPGKVAGQTVGVPAVFTWNGKSWSEAKLPGPAREGYFSAVSATSADNVWAIGGCQEGCSSFAAHYNGSGWTWYSSPAKGPDSGMAALGTSDVWIADYTHLLHRTGRTWKSYNAPGWNGVWTVAGTASNSAWAAGLASITLQPEVLHWNGSSWSTVKGLPSVALPVNGEAIPESIAIGTHKDVYVAGLIEYPAPPSNLETYKPFVLHEYRDKWTLLTIPASFPAGYGLSQLASDGAGGFWASAVFAGASTTSVAQKLVHYSGGTWTVTALPTIPKSGDTPSNPSVDQLAAVPGTRQVWAPIFYFQISGNPRDAIYHYLP
jgi:hypothetical protein